MQGLMDMNAENLVQLITVMSSIFIGVFGNFYRLIRYESIILFTGIVITFF